MDDALPGIIVGLIVAAVAPIVMSWMQGRQRRTERQQEWDRQDAMLGAAQRRLVEAASRVAEVAIQAERQSAEMLEVNKLQLESAQRSERLGVTTLERVEVVHTLVNSNLTTSINNELSSTKRELVLLKEQPEGKETAITLAEDRIKELDAMLVERVEQTRLATEQLKAEAEREDKK